MSSKRSPRSEIDLHDAVTAFHERVANLAERPDEATAREAVLDASLTWARLFGRALADPGVVGGDYDDYYGDLEQLMGRVRDWPALLERTQWYHAIYAVLRTRGSAAVTAVLEDAIAGAAAGRSLADQIRAIAPRTMTD